MYVKLMARWSPGASCRSGSEILESFVTKIRDKQAALRFMKKAFKGHGWPEAITTDELRSYGAAMGDLGNCEKQELGRSANNRIKNSHPPFTPTSTTYSD